MKTFTRAFLLAGVVALVPACGESGSDTTVITGTSFIFAPRAGVLVALFPGNVLVSYAPVSPTQGLETIPVTGVTGALVGIDYRPATGELYGMGADSRVYVINTATGVARAVGAAFGTVLSGTSFGTDFNPTVDRLRVVSDADQNLRGNPNDGTLTGVDTALAFAPGDPNLLQNPDVTAVAYTNSVAGAGATALYGIDRTLNVLVTFLSPNNGQLTTVGPLGVDPAGDVSFDISPGNTAYAALNVGGVTRLYTINLGTGAATAVGTLGAGAAVLDIAVVPCHPFAPAPGSLVALTTPLTLINVDPATPGVIVGGLSLTGVTGTLIGIDFRPATRELYGMSDGGQLYRLNPITGAATAVGTGLGVALSGTVFGFDFNPFADRIRLVSDTDQNVRANPDTGAAVDFDAVTPGLQIDGNLAYALGDPNNGANPDVAGAAYNNNFAGTLSTTLYALDRNLDVLVMVNPPNIGALNTVGPLGLDISGDPVFDIAPASGVAYAVLPLGTFQLFTINLATGAATAVGQLGQGIAVRGLSVAP